MSFKKFYIGKQVQTFEDSLSQLIATQNIALAKMEQVHGNMVVEAKTEGLMSAVDACYTTQKKLFLSVKSADCLPILISGFGSQAKQKRTNPLDCDPFEFVAAAHAGRKSTELKILSLLLETLENRFNIVHMLKKNKQKLNIWFGPAICVNCYQIDREKDIHYNLINKNKKQLFDFFTSHNLDHKKYLNLEIENHCTLHESDKYYSYRATGPGVKMNYSLIGII